MSEFIVLGFVPGTNFQISFAAWLLGVAVVSICATALLYVRRNIVFWLIAISLYWSRVRRLASELATRPQQA